MQNDLISRSALLKAMCTVTDDTTCPMHIAAEIEQYIGEAPAVDAVEVVRCGDCIHRVYKEIEDCTLGGCELIGVALPCDFYCADGKRRADEC